MIDLIDRLKEKTTLGGPKGDCWEWGGTTNGRGYGRISINGVDYGTHRVAYERMFNTKLDPKTLVLHRCDNPPCWNPAHLRTGTSLDNSQDMIMKGRAFFQQPEYHTFNDRRKRGIDHPNAKLTEEQILDIREEYAAGGVRQKDLAQRYGVHQAQISRAVRERSYSSV